ncbi:Ig-like domain-containing protein [Algicola sagamiensis]|uniref:Ig-like domain-containing protein n=1 Tax=Algicola sagamiensis TaxID=163869 RepID=UPI00037D8560|nr:Ig-like domain-containing protein [Algicola sagamiensis]
MFFRSKITIALISTFSALTHANTLSGITLENLNNEMGNEGVYQFDENKDGQHELIATSSTLYNDEVVSLYGPFGGAVEQKTLYQTEKDQILDIAGAQTTDSLHQIYVIEKNKPAVTVIQYGFFPEPLEIELDSDFQPVAVEKVQLSGKNKVLVFGQDKTSLIDTTSNKVEKTYPFGIKKKSNYTLGFFTQSADLEIALLMNGNDKITLHQFNKTELTQIADVDKYKHPLIGINSKGLRLTTLSTESGSDSLGIYYLSCGSGYGTFHQIGFSGGAQSQLWDVLANADTNHLIDDYSHAVRDLAAVDFNQDGVKDMLVLISGQDTKNIQVKSVPSFDGVSTTNTMVERKTAYLRWIDGKTGSVIQDKQLNNFVESKVDSRTCFAEQGAEIYQPRLHIGKDDKGRPAVYMSHFNDLSQKKASLSRVTLESGNLVIDSQLDDQRRQQTSRQTRRAMLNTQHGLKASLIVSEFDTTTNQFSVALYDEEMANLVWSSQHQGDLQKLSINTTFPYPKNVIVRDLNGDNIEDIAFLLKSGGQEKLFAFDGISGKLVEPAGLSTNIEMSSVTYDFHEVSSKSDSNVLVAGKPVSGMVELLSLDLKTGKTTPALTNSSIMLPTMSGFETYLQKMNLKPCFGDKLCYSDKINFSILDNMSSSHSSRAYVLSFVSLENGHLLQLVNEGSGDLVLIELDKTKQPVHRTPLDKAQFGLTQLEKLANGHISVLYKNHIGQVKISQYDTKKRIITKELILDKHTQHITATPILTRDDVENGENFYVDSQYETHLKTSKDWEKAPDLRDHLTVKVVGPKGQHTSYDFTKEVSEQLNAQGIIINVKTQMTWAVSSDVRKIESGKTMIYRLKSGQDLQGTDQARAIIRNDQGEIQGQVAVSFDFSNEAPAANSLAMEVLTLEPVSKQLPAEDAEGGVLTFAVEQPTSGTVVLDDASTGAFIFTPDQKNPQNTSFTYTVTDNQGFSSEGTVTLTQNTAPQLVAQTFQMKDKRTGTEVVKAEDTQKDSMSFVVKVQPKQGEVKITKETGEFTFQSATDVNTDVTFTVEVTDEHEMKSDVVITLKAIKVTTPPVVTPGTGDDSEPTTPPVVTPDTGDGSEPTTPPVVTPDTGNESEPTTPPVVKSNTDDESNTDKTQPSNETKPETKSSHSGGSMFYAFGLLPLVLRRKRQ